METHRLVLPGDLNQYGFLFGGQLLAWVDEASWIAATTEHSGCKFVTMGMNRVEFRHSVREGAILRIESTKRGCGTTSVNYDVKVFNQSETAEKAIFTTQVTFVRVDGEGNKLDLKASV